MDTTLILPSLAFVTGILVRHLWERFLKRAITLRYSIWHQYRGVSSENPVLGTVTLLYNNVPVRSLFNSMVTIVNDSSRDLTNLEIDIVADTSSGIILSDGTKKTSINPLEFTPRFQQYLSENKEETASYRFSRRDYFLPVFNRGDQVEIFLLCTNSEGKQPQISVSCDHPGVKMKFVSQPPQLVLKESQAHSALIGVILGVLACLLILENSVNYTVAIWSAFMIGGFAALWGALAIKLYKFIRKGFV